MGVGAFSFKKISFGAANVKNVFQEKKINFYIFLLFPVSA